MSTIQQVVLIVAVVSILAPPSLGAEWRVELDGSGDFASIQDAVDAASPGDTVLVGPGQFMEARPIPFWSGVFSTVIIEKTGIVVRGAGVGQTIIGNGEPTGNYRPIVGTNVPGMVDSFELYDVTVSGGHKGIHYESRGLVIQNCEFRDSTGGIAAIPGYGTRISDCRFHSMVGLGVYTYGSGGSNVVFERCVFEGLTVAIETAATTNVLIESCTMSEVKVAIVITGGSGVVRDCVATGISGYAYGTGLSATQGGVFALYNNTIDWSMTAAAAMNVVNQASVSGNGNTIMGGAPGIIWVLGPNSLQNFHNNRLVRTGGFSVVAHHYGSMGAPPVHLDMRNNDWGTDDPMQIAEWIDDYHDHPHDPSRRIIVDYIPFISESVQATQETLSDVKRRFR